LNCAAPSSANLRRRISHQRHPKPAHSWKLFQQSFRKQLHVQRFFQSLGFNMRVVILCFGDLQPYFPRHTPCI
jgi:hypothetical protein